MIRRNPLQRLPWDELLRPLLHGATPTPSPGAASRYNPEALEQELELRLQLLADSSGLNLLTLAQRGRVVGDVKSVLLTQPEVDRLHTLKHQKVHVRCMLRSRAKAITRAASRAAAKRVSPRR